MKETISALLVMGSLLGTWPLFPTTETGQELEIRLLCDKPNLIVGEPLRFTLWIKNNANYPVTIPHCGGRSVEPESNYYRFLFRTSNDKPFSPAGRSEPGDVAEPLTLNPQESAFSQGDFDYLFYITSAGYLEFMAEFSLNRDWVQYSGYPSSGDIPPTGGRMYQYTLAGSYRSNVLRVTVSPPATESDKKVLEQIILPSRKKRIGSWIDLEKKIVSEYPDSIRAKYARFYLLPTVQDPDFEKFLDLRKEYIDKNDMGSLQDDALFDLYRFAKRGNKQKLAQSLLQEIFERFPDSDHAYYVKEILAGTFHKAAHL